MKILITTDLHLPSVNGVVTSYLCLIDGLLAKGHEVKVLTLSPNRHTFVENDTFYIGSVSIEFMYPDLRLKRLLPHPKVMKALKEWHPDVVHAQCEFNSFHYAKAIAKQLGIPLINTCHTVYEDYSHYFFPFPKVARRLVAWFSRYIARRCDVFIAPTEKTKRLMDAYKVGCPVAVIPTGLTLKELVTPVSPEEVLALRQKLGIPEGKKVMLSLGRVAKEKNIPWLLQLLEEPALSDAILLIVGDGPFRKELEEIVAKKNLQSRVIFAGMIPHKEIAPYYHLGDIFVNASHSETQGLTFIEAMAFGVPVVCMKDLCVEGVVINGETGYACESIEEMTEHVKALFENPELYAHIQAEGKRLVESVYSKEAFADAVEQVYLDAIKAPKYKKH